MVSKVGQVLLLAVLAALACTGYAIKCYQCESLRNPKCGEKFEEDPSMIVDCARIAVPRFLQFSSFARNATGCMKKTIDAVPGHPQVVRSCYFGDITNTQTGCQPDPSMPFVNQLTCDVCTKDECNGSASLAPIAGAILLFFGVARLLA